MGQGGWRKGEEEERSGGRGVNPDAPDRGGYCAAVGALLAFPARRMRVEVLLGPPSPVFVAPFSHSAAADAAAEPPRALNAEHAHALSSSRGARRWSGIRTPSVLATCALVRFEVQEIVSLLTTAGSTSTRAVPWADNAIGCGRESSGVPKLMTTAPQR